MWKNCHGKTELHYFMFMVFRSEDFALGTRSTSPSEYCFPAVCLPMACTANNGYAKTVFMELFFARIRRLKACNVFSSVSWCTGNLFHDASKGQDNGPTSKEGPGQEELSPRKDQPGRTGEHFSSRAPNPPPPLPGARDPASHIFSTYQIRKNQAPSKYQPLTVHHKAEARVVRLWKTLKDGFAIFATLFKPYCIVALQRTSSTPGMHF